MSFGPFLTARLQTLRGHQGWVKGVSFDPTGRYLATQGTDGCILLWSTSDWSLRRKITETLSPRSSLDSSSRTISFCRLSWTPDGGVLTGCRGFLEHKVNVAKGDKPHVAVLFERRKNFKKMAVLAGHHKPITVVVSCCLFIFLL